MNNLHKRNAILTKKIIGTPPSYKDDKGIAYCKKESLPIGIDDIEYIEISGVKLYKKDIVKYDTLELAYKPDEYIIPEDIPVPKSTPDTYEVTI